MSYSADIWKAVATGGRWTQDELRKELPYMDPARIRTGVWQMSRTGNLVKYEDGSYGVTQDCIIPVGVTVEEVLRATGVVA